MQKQKTICVASEEEPLTLGVSRPAGSAGVTHLRYLCGLLFKLIAVTSLK